MIEIRTLKGKNVKECTGGLIFCSQITVDVDSERKSYDSVWQPHSVEIMTYSGFEIGKNHNLEEHSGTSS